MTESQLEHLFAPMEIGTMKLRNRIMLPPHGATVGNLWGTDKEAQQNIDYWASRAQDGAAWIDGITGFVENTLVTPGFEPTGLGATVRGVFRMPFFIDRAGAYGEAIHKAGACATAQVVLQGGMPHGASPKLANYTNNTVPHELDQDEIRWLVEEYGYSAKQIKAAGLDGVELHANHEDILQLFLSPLTNQRDDEYGGDMTRRLRFVTEVLDSIRAEAGKDFTVGVRFNMEELIDGGYDANEGIEIGKGLAASGHIDYFHLVMGDNWGAPSYIQPHNYKVTQWAELAGTFKKAVGLPVVYAGRVSNPVAGNEVIAKGYADMVGIARAMFAEPNITSKAKAGRLDEIRPCIGCNDCLHRVIVDGLPFGCSVNPYAGREGEGALPPADTPKNLLVIGGGPAGLELAALSAERGHKVTLWERENALGGQVRVASFATENASYGEFITFQEKRLARLGVDVSLGKEATVDSVKDFGADVVAVATGASSREPDIEGVHLPFVVHGRDVMTGDAEVGDRVAVIAMEDHMQPLTIAGFLTDQGKQVQIVFQTPGPAPGVGKYSIGAPMAKLSAAGAKCHFMERVVNIEQGRLATKNVYSSAPGEVVDFDSVVLACGGTAQSGLYQSLKGQVDDLHILGDAYAPRRIVFTTRQAFALAALI